MVLIRFLYGYYQILFTETETRRDLVAGLMSQTGVGVVSSLYHNLSSWCCHPLSPFSSCLLPPAASYYACGPFSLVNRVPEISMLSISFYLVIYSWEPIIVLLLVLEHYSLMLVTFLVTYNILFSHFFPHPLVMISGCFSYSADNI